METMLLRNIEPNSLTLNLILHAFCKAARPEEALGIGDGILPDHRHLQRAAGAVLQHRSDGQRRQAPGNVGAQQVQAKLRDLQHHGPEVCGDGENGGSSSVPGAAGGMWLHSQSPGVQCLRRGLCKTGEMDLASRFLTVMAEEGCRANTATYNSLVEGFCKLGRMDEAERVLEEMIAEGSLPDSTDSVLIQGLCSAGQIEHAFMVMFQVTRAVESARPDPAFVKPIEKLCEFGQGRSCAREKSFLYISLI
ncbi:pentatricopeptide repeat-containing protein At1g06580 [Selaginella moellendorffii]|nr:pentatricopeptide repeat-containing protein At1g06580 [Selaginella moellendorffii]|eukprot:XP_024521626.1 pentatricopeptide repeat-containing protein At1g06580 [Selaginella moellendorffii]